MCISLDFSLIIAHIAINNQVLVHPCMHGAGILFITFTVSLMGITYTNKIESKISIYNYQKCRSILNANSSISFQVCSVESAQLNVSVIFCILTISQLDFSQSSVIMALEFPNQEIFNRCCMHCHARDGPSPQLWSPRPNMAEHARH